MLYGSKTKDIAVFMHSFSDDCVLMALCCKHAMFLLHVALPPLLGAAVNGQQQQVKKLEGLVNIQGSRVVQVNGS